MDKKPSDYLQFENYIDFHNKSVMLVWVLRGILMALDRYAPVDYFPPVPMDVGTFYYLRRN